MNSSERSMSPQAEAGSSYLVERTAAPSSALPFAAVSGSPATAAKHLGTAAIGLDKQASTSSVISLRAHADNQIVTAENAGAAPLIANRTAIGPWEEFDLVHD